MVDLRRRGRVPFCYHVDPVLSSRRRETDGREKHDTIKGSSVCDKFIYLELDLCNQTKFHLLISMSLYKLNEREVDMLFNGILK